MRAREKWRLLRRVEYFMLRLRTLAIAAPLIATGSLAPALLTPGKPASTQAVCIATDVGNIGLTALPWKASYRVAFTDDPDKADIRVALTPDAMAADLAITDDGSTEPNAGCDPNRPFRAVVVTDDPGPGVVTVYVGTAGHSDYRLYLHSAALSSREAAALLVSAKHPAVHVVAARM